MRTDQFRHWRGFTLIEGLVTVAILSTLMALVVPSAIEWIRIQRIKASADELVTDLQFARSEAVRRNLDVQITFMADTTQTCYTVHTINAQACKCTRGAGLSCLSSQTRTELKTVSLPAADKVSLSSNLVKSVYASASGFVGSAGVLQVTVGDGADRKLEVRTNVTGRPSICAPAGSKLKGYSPCA